MTVDELIAYGEEKLAQYRKRVPSGLGQFASLEGHMAELAAGQLAATLATAKLASPHLS